MNRLLKIEYPANLPDILNETYEEFEAEAKLAMTLRLFETGRISSGIASKLLGISRIEFLTNLKNYNISTMNFDKEELEVDVENA
jgi:predicted HTH domain antitoxin